MPADPAESMIEIANKSAITKVSRVFGVVYEYTAGRDRCKTTEAKQTAGKSSAMKNYLSKFAPVTLLLTAALAVPVPVRAQNLGTAIRISTVPDGAYYSVDGQIYTHATTAIWPTGSKHILSTDVEQDGIQQKARFSFSNWAFGGSTLPGGNTVVVTADPSITEYHAIFSVQYAVSVVFFSCPDPTHCSSPGIVYSGSAPYYSDTDIYASIGSKVTLLAAPNPGYVFGGWAPGPGQVIQGAVNTVTVNAPVTVYPQFQVARPINLATIPAGLQVLADRAPVPTPTTLDWGWNSTHSVGPVSPQQDLNANWWIFSSWSDSGAPTHSYTVGQSTQPDTLTATYVPGIPVAFNTLPANLQLSVDNRTNWPSYSFIWGVGETHHFSAPATQTDSQGRIWQFSGWSNGGAAAQDVTVPAGGGVRFTATYTAVGHLTVNSSLPGLSVIVDGNACATPCDIQHPVGTTVKVSAPASVPQGDSIRADFSGWPGGAMGDWSVTLTGDAQTLVANYHFMNRLAASATPSNGATWSLQPSSPDGFYDAQASVVVQVTPLPGFRFHQWNGDLSGTKPIGVVAMNTPRAVQAQLDPVPYIAPAGVANAAGTGTQTGVAPGSIVAVFGASLTGSPITGPANPLAQTLGGVTVRVGQRFMPLLFVSPTQINLQLPDDIGLGQQTLTVSAQGQSDVQGSFTVVRDAPGLFPQTIKDQTFAVCFHQDGSPVTTDSPAVQGETLTLYGTGFGPATASRPEGFGAPASPALSLTDPIAVSVGDTPATVTNAYVLSGVVGVDVIQFQLGQGTPAGTNANLKVTVNGQDSNVVLLALQ